MAALAAKRRGELQVRLDRLARAREALVATVGVEEGRRGGGGGGAADGAVSDGEWRGKYEEVKGLLGRFKAAKKELAALEAEAFVLGRTVAVLGGEVSCLRDGFFWVGYGRVPKHTSHQAHMRLVFIHTGRFGISSRHQQRPRRPAGGPRRRQHPRGPGVPQRRVRRQKGRAGAQGAAAAGGQGGVPGGWMGVYTHPYVDR
jgi:hypothetical protein